jgi:predicted CXXCH cytochrome family protein
MLNRDTVVEMCTSCHTKTISASHVHGPAASDCTACHQAHTSAHKQLLTMEPKALCLSCHENVATGLASAAHVHPPVKDDCLQCHTPHASEQIAILKADPKDLCISCHQKIGETISSASHPHAAVTDARACLNCHTPHASKHANLLADDPATSCLECHKAPIKTESRTIAGVPEIANPKLHKHGPVATGDCNACHGVHGAQEPQLLVQNYQPGFYQPFKEESYALCFKCHDKSLITAEKTATATGFRDADRNLHYVHVAKGVEGRSCRACHTVHASKFDKQIAQTVNYGQWKLPIGFTPTVEGGSCAPGCHKPQSYDRRPLDARPTLEAAPPPPDSGGK